MNVWEMINRRLEAMEQKLDRALELSPRVASLESNHSGTADRIVHLETKVDEQGKALAKTDGRNSIIVGLLVCIGAPIVVGLMLSGIAALFHIQIGG